MKEILTVTDITRMRTPRICIGAVNEAGHSIRPVFESGYITDGWLYEGNCVVIRPFARVMMDLIKPRSQAPHTEDWVIRPGVKRLQSVMPESERYALLQKIVDPSVSGIFGAEIQKNPGYYIRENEGIRSLGTVRVSQIIQVCYESFDGIWGYRIKFADESAQIYNLAVTDLAFHHYLDEIRIQQGLDGDRIGSMVRECLQERMVFLRIGLSRPTWEIHPHCCFLQINAVYSFPDYLDGRCFADFLSG